MVHNGPDARGVRDRPGHERGYLDGVPVRLPLGRILEELGEIRDSLIVEIQPDGPSAVADHAAHDMLRGDALLGRDSWRVAADVGEVDLVGDERLHHLRTRGRAEELGVPAHALEDPLLLENVAQELAIEGVDVAVSYGALRDALRGRPGLRPGRGRRDRARKGERRADPRRGVAELATRETACAHAIQLCPMFVILPVGLLKRLGRYVRIHDQVPEARLSGPIPVVFGCHLPAPSPRLLSRLYSI